MLPIPPLTSAAYAAAQVRQTDDKVQQVRREQARAKDTTASADRFEHSVESSEELQAINPEDERAKQQSKKKPRKPKPPTDEPEQKPPHLDLKA